MLQNNFSQESGKTILKENCFWLCSISNKRILQTDKWVEVLLMASRKKDECLNSGEKKENTREKITNNTELELAECGD